MEITSDFYQERAKLLKEEIKALSRTVNTYSVLRLGVFILSILSVYLFFNRGISAVIIISFITLLLFLFIIKIQLEKQKQLDFKITQLKLIENEIANLINRSNIYDDGSIFIDPNHPYLDDLDIFGVASLFHYINRCKSSKGIKLLASWLSGPSQKKEILSRQIAIKELLLYKKETLRFRTILFPLNQADLTTIEAFISTRLGALLAFLDNKITLLFIKVAPFITSGIFLLAVLLQGIWWNIFGITLLVMGVIYMFFKKNIDELHIMVSKTAKALDAYAETLKWIEETNWTSGYIKQQIDVINSKEALNVQLAALSKIVRKLDFRLNAMVGAFLNLMFLWDLQCLKKLKFWQGNSKEIIESLNLISQFEALISLSTLDHNHPTWVYPDIEEDYNFKAKALGHPLIPLNKRVSNDFIFNNKTTVDVITGSNMAGKSTFLRTVGVNMVLAFAGAKVCASECSTSVFNLVSYMRIKDSLLDETSTFKAEINRLKMILDFTAKDQHAFVLIDEMLRGTNSRDKYLGSKVFIKKLIRQQTAGFIATHDLQIAELEKHHPSQLRNFYFDIQLQGEEMFFDYKIKIGECKTFNASLLLKAIGLEIKE